MTEYDNNLRGRLFKNDRKETDKQPDYTGDCEVGGQKYRLAGWMRKSKQGTPYMSLQLSIPEPQGAGNGGAMAQQSTVSNQTIADEIPF